MNLNDTANGSSAAPALEIEGVSAGYGRTIVTRDVSLVVPPTGIVALLGSNGAGKTTLLRICAGLMKPRSGRVLLDGEDVTSISPNQRARRGLCLVPEGRGIFPSLTVGENLLLHTPPWIKEDRLDFALDAFPDLRDRLKQTAGRLSGGQQQMVALARVYLAQPRVVLLDEISMGLAPLVVDEIFERLVVMAESGMALLLVEQYVNRALEMADRVYLLSQGNVVFSGAASELDEDTVVARYLGAEIST
jgi:branched-chain amino acid transport system ATP-binding protein